VALTAFAGGVVGDRSRFTVTTRVQATGVDAVADQIVEHRLGATLGQALVVLVATDAVGVTGHFHADVRILAQDLGGLVQGLPRLWTQGRLVEVELDTAQVDGDLQLAAVRTDDGTGRGFRAPVAAVVYAITIAVQLRAVRLGRRRRRGRRRIGRRRRRGNLAQRDLHAQSDHPVTEVVGARDRLVVHVVTVEGFSTTTHALAEVIGNTTT